MSTDLETGSLSVSKDTFMSIKHNLVDKHVRTVQVKDVDAFVEGFVASAKDGTWAEKGYSDKSYCMSKVALSALTRDPIQLCCELHLSYNTSIAIKV